MFKKKRLTQLEVVKRELNKRKKRGVTSLYCFQQFGITRLSAIIYLLRHQHNLDISSNLVAIKNKYGDKVYFSKYVLN